MAVSTSRSVNDIELAIDASKSMVKASRKVSWQNIFGSKSERKVLVKQKSLGDTPNLHNLVRKMKESAHSLDCADSAEALFKLVDTNSLLAVASFYKRSPEFFISRNENGDSLLHVAAKLGYVEMIRLLTTYDGIDMDDQDAVNYNTALHHAVLNSQLDAIECLLSKGATPNVLNKYSMAPIHVAVEHNLTSSLKALLKFSNVDPNLPGGNDAPPIHIAAASNFIDCIQLLVEKGACPCKMNASGLSSIHVAAKAGSKDAIEFLVAHAERQGSRRHFTMNMKDRDGNVPLHAAVDSGSTEVVKICLEAGASIDVQQEDMSTPVHFACTRKELDILKLMLSMQADKMNIVLSMRDANGMTPLHNAVALDHEQVVDYLLDQGADMELTDSSGRTSLLLAAASSASKVLSLLITRGANMFHHDENGQNFLHLAVVNRTSFQDCVSSSEGSIAKALPVLLNERDKHGSTPLHYASGDGLLQTIEQLLSAGAEVTVRNNNRDTALHFAARYGRYNSCCRLLDSPNGPFIINVQDRNGCSPLFVAAENGHTRTVNLLLSNGALFHRNNAGLTVLHAAAKNGHLLTVELILNANSTIINAMAGCGNTPLHLAAKYGHVDVVKLLMERGADFSLNKCKKSFLLEAIMNDQEAVVKAILHDGRWKEAMYVFNSISGSPTYNLIEKMPRAFLIVMDNSTYVNDKSINHCEYSVSYNLEFIEPSQKSLRALNNTASPTVGPLPALNLMVKYCRLELLSHPCAQAVLKMKWKTYGRFVFFLAIYMRVIMLLSLTYLNTSSHSYCLENLMESHVRHCDSKLEAVLNQSIVPVPVENADSATVQHELECSARTEQIRTDCYTVNPLRVFAVYLTVVNISLSACFNIFCVAKNGLHFFTEAIDICVVRLAMTISVLLYLAPFIVTGDCNIATYSQSMCGIVAMFLAWMHLFLVLQVHDSVGIYVVMFLEIIKTLLKASLVFAILICGFGFTFHILLKPSSDYSRSRAFNINSTGVSNRKSSKRVSSPGMVALSAFGTPILSVFKVLLMMTGELDFLDTFMLPAGDELSDTLHFPSLTFIILFIFIMCVPIVVMNLMLGLALGNIEAVQKSSALKKICMQVALLTRIEEGIPSRVFQLFHQSTVYIDNPNRRDFWPNTLLRSLCSRWCAKSVAVEDKRKESPRCHSLKMLVSDEDCRTQENGTNNGGVKFGLHEVGMLLERQTQMLRSVMQHLKIASADLEEMEDEQLVSYLGTRETNRVNRLKSKAMETKMSAAVIKQWASFSLQSRVQKKITVFPTNSGRPGS